MYSEPGWICGLIQESHAEEKILCLVDFSEFSMKAYEYAYSLAQHYGDQLFLEHIVQALPAVYAEYPSPGLVPELQRDLEANAQFHPR